MPQDAIASTPEAEWKQVTRSYRKMLADLGFSASEIQRLRLCIPSQAYWKTEADLLEPLSKLQEYKLIHRWRREAKQKQRRLSRRSLQGQPATSCADDPVSSRTRSKTLQSSFPTTKLRDRKGIGAKSSSTRSAYQYAF
ncbi:hypothetical protein FOPG_20104 [Fusarium oxysporum f. sp. conglutinans race 2 54008]|uniref:Uncharacterized protein n=1 Tax=Fusarium oxysporum f. sp. conglutinans race 2 54008 TaxID=1089457 RepID=X0GIY9_FUSOX|nr:hypothetical protein FOPG_20104 [Fusarium oxysporum f. sp. conglutinans race 2 54008]